MTDQEGGEPQKDEHGCVIGVDTWDPQLERCVPIEQSPVSKAKVDIIVENAELKRQLEETKRALAEVTKKLNVANDWFQKVKRGKLIGEIRPHTNESVEDLDRKTTEELEIMRNTFKYARGVRKTIRPGPGADTEQEPRFTVGDISVVKAAKRKMEAELS